MIALASLEFEVYSSIEIFVNIYRMRGYHEKRMIEKVFELRFARSNSEQPDSSHFHWFLLYNLGYHFKPPSNRITIASIGS